MAPRMTLKLKRTLKYEITTVEISNDAFDLQLKLISQLGPRERRVLARAFLRQLKPLLKMFSKSILGQNSHPPIFNVRNLRHKFRAFHSSPVTTDPGRFGFEIRMKRLKLGLTQQEVADQIGFNRTHLSDIERGVHHPMPLLRLRIDAFFRARDLPVVGGLSDETQQQEANGWRHEYPAPKSLVDSVWQISSEENNLTQKSMTH